EMMVCPYSLSFDMGRVGELNASIRIGKSAGFDLRKEGGLGIPAGSSGVQAAMAVSTSTSAPSISRFRSNCSVMELLPREFVDTIESSPAIVVNWRSSGVATEFAMVSGFAPGRLAVTVRVGKSTLGRSLTGRA